MTASISKVERSRDGSLRVVLEDGSAMHFFGGENEISERLKRAEVRDRENAENVLLRRILRDGIDSATVTADCVRVVDGVPVLEAKEGR